MLLHGVAFAERGPVTNLPLPRYVSLKASEGNVRRGPSLTHRIDWVFKRRDMPLLITAEHGHWRRVEDRDGAGGWVHYTLLSGNRTVIVEKDMLDLRAKPNETAPVVANLELGVIANLVKCNETWCRLSADGYKGWVSREDLWGIANGENGN
ncbi:SH3 domain-containing protein [Parasulfitobacter algicola]|uniref:SH3 domain-containing protein n=1 Tax=Parasulfitobacter algicola TaxID=2614809 RepID=A0ABX2J155_9RHOB|nr:SH3 domain-containing protein [Sulfitobacter algicola]NSX56558.1 SH3 domain-containing protein [Sulfitobacter algicola]